MTDKFIQKAIKKIEKKDTEGKFSNKAKKHNMSTLQYANKVIKDLKGNTKNKTDRKLLSQAVFAKNLISIKKK